MEENSFTNLPILREQILQFLDEEGRIVRWPKKTYDKINVLKYLQGKFDPNKKYSEESAIAIEFFGILVKGEP